MRKMFEQEKSFLVGIDFRRVEEGKNRKINKQQVGCGRKEVDEIVPRNVLGIS